MAEKFLVHPSFSAVNTGSYFVYADEKQQNRPEKGECRQAGCGILNQPLQKLLQKGLTNVSILI